MFSTTPVDEEEEATDESEMVDEPGELRVQF